jgi:hypothetical protein
LRRTRWFVLQEIRNLGQSKRKAILTQPKLLTPLVQ